MASSQILRWIDELNGMSDSDRMAKEIKSEIHKIRKEDNSLQNRRRIRQLYAKLDAVQHKPDYMCLIIDSTKDYYRACKGFYINGIKYSRLLGTNGGIKNSTIVFVSERLYPELNRRIENGRNPNKELVTAKLEAYKALTCSASVPVSLPNGVAVVNDCETEFLSDIIRLSDENSREPVMEELKNEPIKLNASDGFGLMLPSLAERWSAELGLDYIVSGLNTRFAFEKGVAFTFDFLDFADKIAHARTIKDAWGNDIDIGNVELILTTSMVKLWDSYKDCSDYIAKSVENGYTFGVTKTCPKTLESKRGLNYQFIQSFNLTDEDIDDLIQPTIKEIKDVINGDWAKTVIFLKGVGLNETNVPKLESDFAKALMIDHRLLSDPFIQKTVYQLIRNRINETKVGVIDVHGNYSIVSGDPYSLCQSMFGLEVTGILKSGEIYNKYWIDHDADELVCFRAPMTCSNNIRLVSLNKTDEAAYWYRYMQTCTIFNSWDTAMIALNGMDFDGDIVMLTDNEVLLRRVKPEPALMCIQRKAPKKIPTEKDFIQSNIKSFGNDIGQTTNWITSMFEVQSRFDKDSPFYEELDYRIKCGQLFQQNAIDRAKGIICTPMPATWHNRSTINKKSDEIDVVLYTEIVADKKPYFMKYIYPALMKQYNTYIKNTEKKSLREFKLSIDELLHIPDDELTKEQNEFIRYYKRFFPVGVGPCVMNRICRRVEEEFKGYITTSNTDSEFDLNIIKSNHEYTTSQLNAIRKIYNEYNKTLKSYAVFAEYEKIDKDEFSFNTAAMKAEYRKDCDIICSDRDALCDILVTLCYSSNLSKKFVWDICGEDIVRNLLKNNDGYIEFPTIDESGDIEYAGNRFKIKRIKIGEDI